MDVYLTHHIVRAYERQNLTRGLNSEIRGLLVWSGFLLQKNPALPSPLSFWMSKLRIFAHTFGICREQGTSWTCSVQFREYLCFSNVRELHTWVGIGLKVPCWWLERLFFSFAQCSMRTFSLLSSFRSRSSMLKGLGENTNINPLFHLSPILKMSSSSSVFLPIVFRSLRIAITFQGLPFALYYFIPFVIEKCDFNTRTLKAWKWL